MTQRASVVSIMIAALILTGCQLDTTPHDVVHFSSNHAAIKDNADCSGLFVLYHDDQDQSVGPIVTSVHLDKGEPYGFELDNQQVPSALAGKQHIPLMPGRYRWEMTPDAGQVDWDKTGGVVVTVVLFTVIVTVSVVSVLFATKQL